MVTKPPIPSKHNRPAAPKPKGPPPPPSTTSYKELPSLSQWQEDTKSGRFKDANDPILETIDVFVHYLSAAKDGAYLYILGSLFFATMSWLNTFKKDPRMVKECRGPVLSLNLFAANELTEKLRPYRGAQLATKLQNLYGIGMSEHGIKTDAKLNKNKIYHDAVEREKFRVFFDASKGACHYDSNTDSFKPIQSGGNGSRFVLSMSNKLYVAADNGTVDQNVKFHSAFMAGHPVQCAGHMWFKNGKVEKIQNSSGHYQPTDASIVKVLNYLRMNQVNLKEIDVEPITGFIRWNQLPRSWATKAYVARPTNYDPTVTADVFMQNHGNWQSILARAKHQPKIG